MEEIRPDEEQLPKEQSLQSSEPSAMQEERPVGYRRPERNRRKKKKTVGRISLLLCLLSIVLLLAVGVYSVYGLATGSLPEGFISWVQMAVLAGISLAALSFLLAVVTLFLPRQKKAAAVTSLILSLLVVLLCGAAIYAYSYVFGGMEHDDRFNDLDQQELNVVQKENDGEIIRHTEKPSETVPPEEIVEAYTNVEVEWELLGYSDLPEDARKVIETTPPAQPSYLKEGSEQISTFVLYGTDKVGSSDSIILLTVDRVHHKIKLISIARDSYIIIPKWGSYTKLTYAYFFDGAKGAVGTLNYNYFLDVTDYISVDMEQLADIIDLVGGVKVNVDWAEANWLRGYPEVRYGDCVLGGEAAVSYARIRSSSVTDNEINRTGRQREVLTSLMQSVKEMPISQYPSFIRTCLGMSKTSFSSSELLDLALEVVQEDYTIESHALLDHVDYWGGIVGKERYFYCVYDLNRASDVLYRLIYEDLYISGYTDEEDYTAESSTAE